MIQISSPLCYPNISLHQRNHMLFIMCIVHVHHKCSISFDTFIKMCGLPCVKFFKCQRSRCTVYFIHFCLIYLSVRHVISHRPHTLLYTYTWGDMDRTSDALDVFFCMIFSIPLFVCIYFPIQKYFIYRKSKIFIENISINRVVPNICIQTFSHFP